METQRMMKTGGDPIGTVLELIKRIWQDNNLESFLLPTNGTPNSSYSPRLIKNYEQLEHVNPFKPLMTMSSAKLVPDILRENPTMRWGAVFRPCEMRALIETAKRTGLNLDNLVTICIDCLGTYPADEFAWRSKRIGSAHKLTEETIQFSRQGGIMAYRYRSACQLCSSFAATAGDINFGVIGLPVRQFILLFTRSRPKSKKINIDNYGNSLADDNLLNQREYLIAKLSERRQRTYERVIAGIADILPTNPEALVEHFVGCGRCQACFDECPLCSINFPQRTEDKRYRVEDIKNWLVSCAGCGMCEQACPRHLPLSAIFSYIRDKITKDLNYFPGVSLDDPLPHLV